MKTWIPLVLVCVALSACEKRSVPPQQSGAPADSQVADTMKALDSNAVTIQTLDSKAVKPNYPPTIGHDSAFGPIGSIDDSTGKFTKIPPRRP